MKFLCSRLPTPNSVKSRVRKLITGKGLKVKDIQALTGSEQGPSVDNKQVTPVMLAAGSNLHAFKVFAALYWSKYKDVQSTQRIDWGLRNKDAYTVFQITHGTWVSFCVLELYGPSSSGWLHPPRRHNLPEPIAVAVRSKRVWLTTRIAELHVTAVTTRFTLILKG